MESDTRSLPRSGDRRVLDGVNWLVERVDKFDDVGLACLWLVTPTDVRIELIDV